MKPWLLLFLQRHMGQQGRAAQAAVAFGKLQNRGDFLAPAHTRSLKNIEPAGLVLVCY